MKTLMTFLVVAVVNAFSIPEANAQGNKFNFNGSYEEQFWLDCVGEQVSGTVEYSFTWWEHGKLQNRVTGTYTGDITGEVYTYSLIINDIIKTASNDGYLNGAFTLTSTGTYCWKSLGSGIISKGHQTFHMTYNHNGGHNVSNLVSRDCN